MKRETDLSLHLPKEKEGYASKIGERARSQNSSITWGWGESFSFSESDRDNLEDYLFKHFNLELKNNSTGPTTLSGNCNDWTFYRYIHLIYKTIYIIICTSSLSIQWYFIVTDKVNKTYVIISSL